MDRNLIICCDGTNNEFGPENTNVVRLVQILKRDPKEQHLYYDPGVGTMPEPGMWNGVLKWFSKVGGLAFGFGLTDKVEEAYRFLMEVWEPGDKVFLFGFSRGSYTVRVLAGMLHALGLVPRGGDNLIPYVMKLFKSVRNMPREKGTSGKMTYWELCDEFRWTFARPVTPDRSFPVHFLGVWDTVSSVGWVWDPATFPFTADNPSVSTIRHAVSIDERRCFFRQNLFDPNVPGQDLMELWFPGVHSDVGGGYPEREGGLWREPFRWMVDCAAKAGLLIDPARLAEVEHRSPIPAKPWAEPQHESLTAAWWPAEFFPKLHKLPSLPFRTPVLGLGHHRKIHRRTVLRGESPADQKVYPGAVLHGATILRIREKKPAYLPPNIPPDVLAKIRALPTAPHTFEI